MEPPPVHSHVHGPTKTEPERPSERAPSHPLTPASLLASPSTPSVTPSLASLPAQHPPELTSEEEEEEVELVDWDDDDDFEAASPIASDALGGESLAGLEAGCAAAPSGASPAPRFGGSSAALLAESSAPSSPASVLAAPSRGDAEAPVHLKSILIRPAAPSPAGKQGLDRGMGEPLGVKALQCVPVSPEWRSAKTGRRRRRDASPAWDATAPRLKPRRALEAGREAYFKRLAGRCFRCLASDHMVANCRDPVRCFNCKGVGHLSRSCPAHRPRAISSKLRARLTFPPREHP